MTTHIGEIAALITAVCWTISAIIFESAVKKVGALSVNYLRLFIALIFLSVTSYFSRGIALPIDAAAQTWFWLLISGLFGFVLGDLFLLQAYSEIGSRIAMLIMSAAPPVAALFGFLIMGERISLLGLSGMSIIILGISMVILSRNPEEKKIKFNRPLKGIFYASLGAIGQASGLIFSKLGMGSYNVLGATQIRIIAAVIYFTITITAKKKWPEIGVALKDKNSFSKIIIAAIFGTFFGVTLSLIALQYTSTGIVSSLSSLTPIFIIPAAIVIFKEKVLPKEVFGAFISTAGVILLFL